MRLIGGEGCWHKMSGFCWKYCWWKKSCTGMCKTLYIMGETTYWCRISSINSMNRVNNPPPSYCHRFLISGGKNLVGLRAVTWLDQSTWFGSVCCPTFRSRNWQPWKRHGWPSWEGFGLGICQFISWTGTENMCSLILGDFVMSHQNQDPFVN